MTDPDSTRPDDVTLWLGEGGDLHLARCVRQRCEARLTEQPLVPYIDRYDGDDDSPAGRRARRIVQTLLYEAIYRNAPRPAEVGALRWWVASWGVWRMVRSLVDLWFRSRSHRDAARARSENAYTVRLAQPPSGHSPSAGVRRTLAESSPGVPEPARECDLSDVRQTRQAHSGDLR